jgi:hypothetical protein
MKEKLRSVSKRFCGPSPSMEKMTRPLSGTWDIMQKYRGFDDPLQNVLFLPQLTEIL